VRPTEEKLAGDLRVGGSTDGELSDLKFLYGEPVPSDPRVTALSHRLREARHGLVIRATALSSDRPRTWQSGKPIELKR
jgi:hypothetical protein